MRTPLLLLFAVFCVPFVSAQEMTSTECGTCHESQFAAWSEARHSDRGVVCSACHGDFHSGSLNGCTPCHSEEHDVEYRNWQMVKDYRVEGDTSDYYCIVCHNSHNPKKAQVLLCNSCHGSPKNEPQPRKGFRIGIQKAHNIFADIAPRMDEDAWNRRIKSRSGKLMLGAGVAVAGGLLIFPYLYTAFAFIRWVKRRRSRRNP